MSAILLISICDHAHITETPVARPEIDDRDNLVGGFAGSDRDFCPVCDSPRMEPLGWRVEGMYEGMVKPDSE